MAVSVLSAAKRLGEKSNWSLSNLVMQKILYLTHMFYMGKYGEPLVNGHFEAWNYGPVHPDLYQHVKRRGNAPIKKLDFENIDDISDKIKEEVIDQACEVLSNTKVGKLVGTTHRIGGAWEKNYIMGYSRPIPDADILEEYQKRMQ